MLPLCVLSACGDKDQGIDSDTDTVDTTDGLECSDDDDCDDAEICEVNECVAGDRSDSADEALTLAWDDGPSRSYYINPENDVDYFEISSAGGEYVRIRTITPEDKGSDLFDTVVTIRDANQQILARVDNYPTGATFTSSDSSVYAYLPDAGSYIIEVEDHGSVDASDDIEPFGDDIYSYTIQVDSWGSGTSEDDTADDPSLSYEFTADDAGSYWPLGVALESEGDVDYVDFTFPYNNARFILYAQEDSYNDAIPLVRIYNADEEMVAELDEIAEGRDRYTPSLSAGSYRMEITDTDGEGGTDRWFFLYMSYGSEDSLGDWEVESNDSALEANYPETTESSNSSGTYTFTSAKKPSMKTGSASPPSATASSSPA
jgi:hypothetical protein